MVAAGGLAVWRAQAAASRPLAYTSAAIARGDLSSSATSTGTVEAWQETVVHSQTSGFLQPFNWNPSDRVRTGQTLFTLSDPTLSSQLVQDAYNLRLARDTQAQLASQLSLTAGQKAAVDAAERNLASALETAAQDRRSVADLKVVAPVGGTVSSLNVQPGQTVGSGAAIATITWAPSAGIIAASVPPSDAARLQAGMRATVTDAGHAGSLPARLIAVGRSGRVTLSLSGGSGAVSGRVVVAIPAAALTASGMVEAGDQMTVAAQQGGTVARLAVGQDQVVRPGETVAVLADPAAQDALAQATQAVATARDQLTEARASAQDNQVQLQSQLAQQAIKVTQAQDTLDTDRATAAQLSVTSPVSGVISQVMAVPGQWVTNGTPLLTVGDYRRLTVTFPLDQSYVDQIHVGQGAQVTTDAVPGKTFAAKVYLISPEGTDLNGVATFNVTVVVPHPAGLKPGMAADVAIVTGRATGALYVPIQALHVGASGHSYVVVVHAGTFLKVPVRVGISDQADAVVTGRLHAGEQVVTSSLAQLRKAHAGLRVNGQYLRRRVVRPKPRFRRKG